ncbi:MAG: redoxin domain-containing protein [Gemmatimonadales bacterium]
MSLPLVSQPAPDFTLSSTSGGEVTLSALRGRAVLLAFFPAAFTSTCTAEMCAFSDDYADFEAAGAVVLPISVDATASLKAYKAHEKLSVDLLSDFHRTVSRAYGVLDEARFRSQRAYVLVDKGGVVRWTHLEEHPGLRRENSELLDQVRALS